VFLGRYPLSRIFDRSKMGYVCWKIMINIPLPSEVDMEDATSLLSKCGGADFCLNTDRH